jgi:hypothetical protein
MTVELDPVLHVGAVVVGALAERSVRRALLPGLSIYGSKHPVAVLIRRDGVTMGFNIDGEPIAADEFERRFPGCISAFERAATGTTS